MKLDFRSASLRNFLTYGNQTTQVDFKKGINLVLGHDETTGKSNSSGKSNLLMSILFALYGRIPKEVKKNGMVNWESGKNCEVSLEFYKGDTKYNFHRGISPNYFEVYEDDKKLPVHTDLKNFQKTMENEVIGMDYNSSKNFVYCNPNNVISIINTPKDQKRKLIESLFNVEIFSKMNSLANEKLRSVSSKIEVNSNEEDSCNKNIDKLQSDISQIEIPDIKGIQQEYERLKTQYQEKYKESIDEEIEGIKEEKNTCKENIDSINDQINEIDRKIVELQTEKKGNNKRITEIGNIEEEKEKYKELQEKKDNCTLFDESELEEIRNELEELENEKNEYDSEIKAKKILIQNLPQPDKLEGKSNCPTCGLEVDPESIREDTEKSKSNLETDRNNLEEHKKNIETKIQEKEKELKQKQDSNNYYYELEREINKFEYIESREKELEDLQRIIQEIDQQLEELNEKKSSYENDRKEHQEQKKELEKKENEYIKYKEQISSLYNEMKLKEQEYENAKKLKEREEQNLEEKREELRENQSKLEELQKNRKKLDYMRDHLEFSKSLLKDENLKQYAISSHIPFFNSQVNNYLSQVGFNFYLNIDNWMDLEVHGPGMKDASLNNLGGGQAKSIDLAIKFALMDMAKMQAASYPDILILDEILDSSIDKQGLNEIMNIIEHKKEKDDLKIFLISHREEMQDMEQIDSIYNVKKDNEVSKLISC